MEILLPFYSSSIALEMTKRYGMLRFLNRNLFQAATSNKAIFDESSC